MPLKADFKCQTVTRKYLFSRINYLLQIFETKSFNIVWALFLCQGLLWFAFTDSFNDYILLWLHPKPPCDLLQKCLEFNKAPSLSFYPFPSDASYCSPCFFPALLLPVPFLTWCCQFLCTFVWILFIKFGNYTDYYEATFSVKAW